MAVDRDVLALRGKQVVDDGDVSDLLGQEPANEIGADKPGSSDDQDATLDAYAFSPTALRWVYVCSMPCVL